MSEIEHYSDCAVHNEPAFPAGPCNCGGIPMTSQTETQSETQAVVERKLGHLTPDEALLDIIFLTTTNRDLTNRPDHELVTIDCGTLRAVYQSISDRAALISRQQEEIGGLMEKIKILETPKCFACGAFVTEDCLRFDTMPCGREFKGGSRAALQAKP